MWRIGLIATLLGIVVGLARAALESGGFDSSVGVASFQWPASDLPDYWRVPTGKRAKAVLDAEEFQFGKLEVGRKMRHSFRVTNGGDFPLVLAKRESSCICTLAELDETTILPGESAEVTLEWTAPASGLPGEPYRQWTTIDTNDAEKKTLTLYVEGELAAAVATEQDTLSFGTVAKSQSKTVSTRLVSYRAAETGPNGKAESLAVVGTEFDDATAGHFFDVKFEPNEDKAVLPAGAAAALKVTATLKPGLPEGPFRQTIRLRTNLADVPPVAVTVVGEIRPDVYLFGPGYSPRTNSLALGKLAATQVVERRLTLVAFGLANDGKMPRVADISPARLEAEIVAEANAKNDGSRRWILIVRARPELQDDGSTTTGKIVIETGHAEMPRLELIVSWQR
jgi:hypothetical protein